MVVMILYYSIAFVFALFLISRLMLFDQLLIGNKKDVKNTFYVLCITVITWSFSIVAIGVSQIDILDKILLFISDFLSFSSFIIGAELCSSITDRAHSRMRSSYSISSILLYAGLFVMVVRLIMGRADTSEGLFGLYFTMNMDFSFILHVIFYVAILFFCGAYTYMHYYTSNTKRQLYISKQCVVIVSAGVIALIMETLGYIYMKCFVPALYFAMIYMVYKYKNLINYKRSIEYNEDDYKETLSPSNEKPAFVCNDEGLILFENTRAFVMRQTYKDSYIGKYITELFEISDYDRERLKEPRNTQVFEIYCKYPKEEREMLLLAKHNLDKFGDIFSTEISVSYALSYEEEEAVVAARKELEKKEAKKKFADLNLTYETVNDIRTKELIKLIANQKKFYEDGNKKLFEINLKGIEKASAVLGLSTLQELCDRIQTELLYGEWDGLNTLMIDLDRQYETLMFINY